MGPDFLGNSCSNTLRSNCSQLKWPLRRQYNKTINVWTYEKDKCPYFHYLVAISSLLCSPLIFPPFLSFFSPSPTERKLQRQLVTLVTLVSWATDQHLSQKLSLSQSLPTQPLWPVNRQSWGICSLQAHVTNQHITVLALGTTKLILLYWTDNGFSMCHCHVNGIEQRPAVLQTNACLRWNRKTKRYKGSGDIFLYVNHLYVCMSSPVLSCCGASIFICQKTHSN